MSALHFVNKNFEKLQKLRKLHSQTIAKCASTWKQPSGCETPIKIYNCIAKTQVPLILQNKHLVSWYTCGPTVYDDAHIGHASCYMRVDILQRILKHNFGLNIVSTMNITDVDDKIILRSNSRKVPFTDLAKQYESTFWEDMDLLGIARPDKILRVTQNMPLIIDFIEKLLSDNLAYKGGDGSIYFDVKQYESIDRENKYGKLQNIAREENNAAGKSKIKKNIEDFALWKSSKPGEPSWDANFGPGRPGWHVECSSMASSFYGKTIDVHAGGIDLRFPHHENEEAQSCAYHGRSQWVNYWLHMGHLHLPHAAKMSKSLKNTVSIRELLETCDPTAFRMTCLLTNYKSNIEFSPEHLKLAEAHVKTLKNFIANVSTLVRTDAIEISVNSDAVLDELSKTIESVDSALCRDFDTPGVIKAIEGLITVCNKVIHSAPSTTNIAGSVPSDSSACLLAVCNYVQKMCHTLGLNFGGEASAHDDKSFNEVMDVLVNFRHQLRTLSLVRKDKEALALCDDVRDECRKLGIGLKDHARVSTWSK